MHALDWNSLSVMSYTSGQTVKFMCSISGKLKETPY